MERELLLLGFLRREQAHGYRLNEFIERDMAACTDIKKPTAYFLLDKMAKQGWITMRETREGNRPPRRVYRVTAKGEAQYQKLLRENLGSFIAAKFPGDVGLAYADDLEAAGSAVLVSRAADGVGRLNWKKPGRCRSMPVRCNCWSIIKWCIWKRNWSGWIRSWRNSRRKQSRASRSA